LRIIILIRTANIHQGTFSIISNNLPISIRSNDKGVTYNMAVFTSALYQDLGSIFAVGSALS